MAQLLARPVADLIEAFSRLPGIGPKTASRLTFYLLRPGWSGARAGRALGAAIGHSVVRTVLQRGETSPAICGTRAITG
jgi:hypothetical protein